MDHDLLNNIVPITNVHLTSAAPDTHPTHVRSGGDPRHEGPDALVRLLRHPPQVHEVHGLVHRDHRQLPHLVEEQRRGGERGVSPRVEYPLSEIVITCIL